jgi:murein DD-endopeptidase MepM/ murein hydrolase activator NlpD
MSRTKKYINLYFFSIFCFLTVIPPLFSAADSISHVLKDGETLYAVSRLYKVPVDALIKVNSIADPGRLKAGTRLVIPDIYEVKRGDTLFGLSKRFNIKVDNLIAMNGLKENTVLKVGEKLYVPGTTTEKVKTKSEPLENSVPVKMTAEKTQLSEPDSKRADGKNPEFFWPHGGSKRNLDGKLEGLSFEGRPGDPIYAVASGKVVWIGPYRGFGKVVFLQSDQGYVYVYAGNEDILVKIGEIVKRGQKIGTLGIHPYEQRSNLYFIVYKDGKPVRPEDAPRI